MASYFDKLKEGIEEKNWNKVADAYYGMTGIRVKVPEEVSYEEEEKPIVTYPSRKPVKIKRDELQRDEDSSIAKKTPVVIKRGNLFKDTLTEKTDLLPTKEEKKKWVKPDLGRTPAKTAKVACRGCGHVAFVDVLALGVSKNLDGSETVNDDYCCGNCLAKGKR